MLLIGQEYKEWKSPHVSASMFLLIFLIFRQKLAFVELHLQKMLSISGTEKQRSVAIGSWRCCLRFLHSGRGKYQTK